LSFVEQLSYNDTSFKKRIRRLDKWVLLGSTCINEWQEKCLLGSAEDAASYNSSYLYDLFTGAPTKLRKENR